MDNNSQKGHNKLEIMTIGEVAEYLKVSEKTVFRMIGQGKIPCTKVAGQWRFVRTVIDDWLIARMKVVPKNDLARLLESETDIVPLSRLIEQHFINLYIQPGSKENVLRQLIKPFVEKGIIRDSDLFLEKLMLRESMASTGIGRGVAIPHVRNPLENPAGGPLLSIGICRGGTDFKALDGKLTHLFFLIYTDSEVVHLRVMAKLTSLLRNEDNVIDLINARAEDDVIKILVQIDQENILAT
ncbi:MAG: PTS sugar transporter subunit IIA [Spirochaetota bacterium]|nr:MAG: PTS sugar transporter subunit IIA [Spirochaetota bacterium]